MPERIMERTGYRRTIRVGNVELSTNLIFLVKLFKRIIRGYSPLVLIVGKQRVGKSYIAVFISYLFLTLMGKKMDPAKIHEYAFYDPVKSIDTIGEKEKEPIIIDEAGSILTKREWYKKSHIALDKIIQTQGYKTMMYIFVSPFAIDIDKTFIKHFDFLLRVDDRGNFKVYQLFKRYDEFKTDRVVRRMFLEDVFVNLDYVPSVIWNAYSKYSKQEKEKLRIQAAEDTVVKISKLDSPLHRLKEGLVR